MAGPANFTVVADANRHFGDIEEIAFTLPGTCNRGARAVLWWMMTIKTSADRVDLEVRINGHKVYTGHYGSDRYGPMHEVINPDVLQHGDNVINFLFAEDDKTFVVISDIVIMWREQA